MQHSALVVRKQNRRDTIWSRDLRRSVATAIKYKLDAARSNMMHELCTSEEKIHSFLGFNLRSRAIGRVQPYGSWLRVFKINV